MNNSKLNIDDYTKQLIQKGEILQPKVDFTKSVMSKILKDPAVKVNFISNDDKQGNIWLIVSLAVMIAGSMIFFFVTNGFSFSQGAQTIENLSFIKGSVNYFSQLWTELSLSPYILISIIGVIVLVVLDKTIVKYLYSI